MKTKKKGIRKFDCSLIVGVAYVMLIAGIFISPALAQEYKQGEILVKFKAVQQENALQCLRSKLNAIKVKKFSINNVYQLKLPAGASVESAVSSAYADSSVEYAEPNYVVNVNATTPNDPKFANLWAMNNTGQTGGAADADIDASEAWDIIRQVPDNIVIAVIDTGVDYTHPDLASNMWHNPGEIAGNGIDDDGNGYVDDVYGYDFCNNDSDPMDDNSHGTHCSGTIGAVGNNGIGVTGVCWGVKIMAVKFLSSNGSGYTSDAISAIQYAVANGAKILSNSWGGGGYSQALKDAITASQNAGAIFVAAAGNSGTNNDTIPHYPSSYNTDNIISVAATDNNDNLAYFSCYGPASVDIAAPGVGILSTVPNNSYAVYSGTSMATPHISGICGLIWAKFPELTNLQVKARILSTVDQKTGLQGKILSRGRVNLYKALTYGDDNTPPSAVTDLAVIGVTTYKSVNLSWTSTGDDNLTGTASTYDLRYSTSQINENNFNSAKSVTGLPAPKLSGSQETFTVQNLSPGITYYFALKVLDEWGNSSGISNIVSAVTGTADILYQNRMENGLNGWTASGTDGNNGPGLWHMSQNRFNSNANSWYYSNEKALNYDTGARNYGSITSPEIDITNAESADLIFSYWRSVESYPGPYDKLKAEISYDSGSTWQSLWTIDSSTASKKAWTNSGYLQLETGHKIKIRFSFDTIDNIANAYEGVYIDDIEIVGLQSEDNTPPAKIADLACSKIGANYITVQWTASGGDGTEGTALFYDMRYSTSPITAENWANAEKAVGEPAPQEAGTLETFTITELKQDMKYYIAIKSRDNANNESELSNIINAVTLTPPTAEVNPAQMPVVTLQPGETTTQTLTITNTGGSPLKFSLTNTKAAGLTSTTVQAEEPQQKKTAPIQNSIINAEYVEDEILVKFNDGVSRNAVEQINSEIGAEIVKYYPEINVYRLRLNSGLSVTDAVQSYSQDSHTLYAEPNYIAEAFVMPNDPKFTQLYGLNNTGQTGGAADADVDAPEAWNYFTGSKNITIAVIDTGVDYNHPDLAANIWVNPNEIAGNGIDDDGNGYIDDVHGYDFCNNDSDPMDDHSHGTHCSGTIGAVGNNGIGVTGINWTTQIMALKFLSSSGSGSYADAVKAIIYSANMGVRISSNSWGGSGYSQALKDAIEYAGSKGELFVAAAGNSGADSDVSPLYPAAYNCPNIISVAATDCNDNLAYFSNYGSISVDLGAPGVSILSTVPNNSYAVYSGTSMATPHVSGAAGLILSQNPSFTYSQVKQRLLDTADPIPSLSGKTVTGGRLNIYNAIQKENDSVPPDSVTDLASGNTTFKSVTLTWTATGDDGKTGSAALYDLRYSTFPITEENFADAVQIAGEPAPQPAGNMESVTVTGLEYNTTYYFALKVIDNVGNSSSISNLAQADTMLPTTVFQDDMEQGTGEWTAQVPWAQTSEWAHSGAISWTDSSGGNYENNLTASLTSRAIDLSKLATASLEFWHKYELEKDYDYGYIEISADNGSTWTQVKSYTGIKSTAGKTVIDLTSYAGKTIRIRFKLVTDESVTYDGWHIDDVVILGSAASSSWLKPDITNGTIQPNKAKTITLTYDSAGMETGSYSTELNISTNDPSNYLISVLASLIIETSPAAAPPVISITSPSDGATVKDSQINVSGAIDCDYSAVTVNGKPAAISNHIFGATIGLSEGQNTITVIAVNSAGSTTKSIHITLDTTPPTVSITSPSNGTAVKETSITVAGTISDNTGVSTVTVNSQKAEISAASFTVTGIALDEGANTITAQALDIGGNTKSASITVTRDTTPPAITIAEPSDGTTAYSPIIDIAGSIDDLNADVKINGFSVTLNNGAFSKSIGLSKGANTITITASDSLGNTSTKSISINYVSGPMIEVTPAALPDVTLAQGETDQQAFTISNTGDTDLVYNINIADTSNSSESESDALETNQLSDTETPVMPKLAGHHPSRLLVKFKNGIASAETEGVNSLVGAETIKTYAEIGVQKVEITSSISIKEAIGLYMQSGFVEYAEPDFTVQALVAPNDPYFSQLWGLNNTGQAGGTVDADIDCPEAWNITKGSSNVIIAVIDTGINYNHPDLAANIWTGSNGEHGYDFCNNDSDPMDDNGHGSHCSGTIAGVGNNGVGVTGINWTAKIMAVKFLNSSGSGYTSDAVDGILYAVNHGARILSNSWGGGGYSQALKDAIEYANSHNVLFVAAAGNSGNNNDTSPSYPASYNCSNIISVAAIDHNANLASWSCYGANSVDIGAPGVGILSTVLGSSYATYSGTSMATPHVSGVAGLVLSQNLNQSDEQIKARILAGAVHISSLTGKCVTGGMLNAYNSLEKENDETPPAAITDLEVSGVTFQSATLTWTATGDDSKTGTASSYDIRYSTSQITASNFNSASQAANLPIPKASGHTETLAVSGLSENTHYYFAVKAADESLNTSGISNTAQGITAKTVIIFSDTGESGASSWNAQSPWALVTNKYKSANHSWHDSPNGNYANNENTKLTSQAINLTNYNSAMLIFWHRYDLETYYDYGYLQISIDNGSHWILLKTYNGHQNSWEKESVDLTSYCGHANIKLRFKLVTDYSVTYDGWYIDDVKIYGSNNPSWLSANSVLGTIEAGKSKTITLSYNANVMSGKYNAEINVNSNAVNNSSVSINTSLTVTAPENTARYATVTASSEYSSSYKAANVRDGLYGLWDQGEWAAQGSWDRNPWIKLSFNSSRSVNKIIIYGRPNKYDSIQNARIILSSGYSVSIGEIPAGGAPKIIYFPKADIKWIKFQVLETTALNPGLAEIQLFYEPIIQQSNINIAPSASASASSQYSSSYSASCAIDRIVGQWNIGEWAANGSTDKKPWLKLLWNTPQTINKIVIYGRPNKYDSIQNARIILSSGYSAYIGEIPAGGAPKIIYLSSPQQITWLKFKITETSALNPGLTEIEVYNESESEKSSNTAKLSTASASSQYSSSYSASCAIDGIIGQWNIGEWAANGSTDKKPWLKLLWNTPQTINKIVIYGRPNKYDKISNARITLSNGYSRNIGEIPIGGAPKIIYIPTVKITWLKFNVLETSALNPGLTEIEVYYDGDGTSSPYYI